MNKSDIRLSVDFDSVLVDFMEPWFDWLIHKRITNFKFNASHALSYDWLCKQFGPVVYDYFREDPFETYTKVQMFPGAKEFLNWCFDNFEHVEIVTHSDQDTTAQAKLDYVKTYFDTKSIKFFSKMDEKFKHTSDSILIDDYPLHCVKHIVHNDRPAILFDWNNNNGWSKLGDYIDLLEELKPDLGFYHKAYDYEQTKNILKGYL